MKLTLDLPSVLAGGAILLVLGLVAGFNSQATQVPGATNIAPRPIAGQSSPHPRDFVWLRADPSQASDILVVPQGKILVLTGISSDKSFCYCDRRVDLVIDSNAFGFTLNHGGSDRGYVNPVDFHSGIPLVRGQSVQLAGVSHGFAWLHGYWAND